VTVCPLCGTENPGRFAFCGACGSPLVVPNAGQRKTVSILFCDLVDSTVLGSAVDAEVLGDVLARYWRGARSVVERHGGTVEKFIGDAVVGVFGIPVVHEDDALRAVRAAADLLVEVRDLNKDLQARLGVELAVRIGVNTGEVLSGGEALMSGDAANVAARLEGSAGAGEVLLGEATYRLVRDLVEADDVSPLVVKGKAEPLSAFRLLGVHSAAVGQRRRRFSGPLVGRDRQLRMAEAMYATAVEESACVLLTVLGEPGVGKSRLVEELLAGIGGKAWVLQGRCLPYGDGITYWPTTEMLTGLAEHDPTSLDEHLVGVPHAVEISAGLATMLGAAKTATGREVAWAFRRFVETLARRQPLVLVVDDLQWAEPGMVDLLEHLTDMSRGAPILLVCMARPEFLQTRPGWGSGRPHAFAMALSPLSDLDCRALTAELLGAGIGEALLRKIVVAAEGVPLFVEELTAMLVDEGQLVQDGSGGWRAAPDLEELTVPASVHALLAARLDGLAPDLRHVLDAASVIGKTFYPEAVAVLVDEGGEVTDQVEALQRADLVQPTTTDLAGHDAFTFNHQLLRDAAYQGLTKARRAELHLSVARWLQLQPASTVSPEVVAFHLEAATAYRGELGDFDSALADEAAQLLLTAADRALALADATAAVGLAARAERLARGRTRLRAEIALTLSEATSEAGDYRMAVSWADEAELIGAVREDDALQWRARLHKGRTTFWTQPAHRSADTHALTQRAIEALHVAGDDRGLAMAYHLQAEMHNMLGRLRASSADAKQGLRHSQRAGWAGPHRSRLIRRFMGPYRFGDGSMTEMTRAFGELINEFESDPVLVADLARERDLMIAFDERLDEATRVAIERYVLLLDRGSTTAAAEFLSWTVAWCQRWAGDLAGAAESLVTAATLFEGVGGTGMRSTTLADLAIVFVRLGRDDEARAVLAQGRAITMHDDLLNHVFHGAAEGLLLAQRGDAKGSDERFRESLRIAADTEFSVDHADIWLARSEAQRELGDTAGAIASARQALVLLEQKEQRPPIRIVLARLAELGA